MSVCLPVCLNCCFPDRPSKSAVYIRCTRTHPLLLSLWCCLQRAHSPLLTWTDVTFRSVQMRTGRPVKTKKTTLWLWGDVFFLRADGECKDKCEVRETGSVSCGRATTSRAASSLESTKYSFCYITSVFVFPLIWISLAGHHCKSQRWAAAKLMLINETVVIQESREDIRGFWASHDHGECQVIWPPLCLQAWRRRALQPPSSILRLAVKKPWKVFHSAQSLWSWKYISCRITGFRVSSSTLFPSGICFRIPNLSLWCVLCSLFKKKKKSSF